MQFRLVYNGYHTPGSVNGHPVIGTGHFFLSIGLLFFARLGLFGISALLVNTLWNSKIKGKYAHIMLWVYGVTLAWLFDYFGIWTVLHTRAPRGEQGFANGNAAFLWWLYHTYLMWSRRVLSLQNQSVHLSSVPSSIGVRSFLHLTRSDSDRLLYAYVSQRSSCSPRSTAKYGYRLNAAGRGVALPVATVVFISVFVQGFGWGILDTVSGKGLLLLRLVVWPIITELITAPIRAFLRGIPEEWADKAGVAYAMVPVSVILAGLGRFFQYKVTGTGGYPNRS